MPWLQIRNARSRADRSANDDGQRDDGREQGESKKPCRSESERTHARPPNVFVIGRGYQMRIPGLLYSAPPMAALGRRAFLLLASLFAPVARLRGAAQRPPAPGSVISVEEFLRLSQRLVGRSRLDAQVAATYLDALLAVPANRPLLARLARENGPELTAAHVALERTIIEWWYTGTYTLGSERRLATHTGALMWNALGTRAPGTCAPGGFGEWSRPPRPTV